MSHYCGSCGGKQPEPGNMEKLTDHLLFITT